MEKMKEHAPNFELQDNLKPDNSPIGYPNMSQKDPASFAKLDPPKRKYVYHEGPLSHSINPERPSKYKGAEKSEMKLMKLEK